MGKIVNLDSYRRKSAKKAGTRRSSEMRDASRGFIAWLDGNRARR